MSLRRSAGSSGAAKVSRKVRVTLGKSKGSGDSGRTLGPKNSTVGKTRIRVGLITEKRSGDDSRAREARKMGGKKVKRRGNGNDAVLHADVNEKLSGKGRSETRGFKAKNMNEKLSGRGSFGKRDWKTKNVSEELSGRGSMWKRDWKTKNVNEESSGRGSMGKRDWKTKNVNEESSGRGSMGTRDWKTKNVNKELSGRGSMGKRDLKTKTRKEGFEEVTVGNFKQVQKNAFGSGTLKKKEKVKDSLSTGKNLMQSESAVGSLEKTRKKRDQGKGNLDTDSDLMEIPRKKKKRGIQIDPHDTSNKRLDDSTRNNDNNQTKKDSKEDAVELSQNAQFRAIRPSASILSFVEDNLLGRRRDIEFKRAGYNNELSAPLDNIPFSTGSERERIEVPVFKNKLEFFAAAKVSSSFPPLDLPEIAFAGRSNVGKSSLLNSLTRQWGVVRTSDKPGLTQTINFFKLGPKLSLVDLPGYGFAYAKDEVKEAWEELVKEYVSTRASLKRVCLLVDTKWGMKPRDHELIDLMERFQTKYQIVLTKTDLVFPIDVARRAMQIEENLKAKKSAVQPLMMVSSKTGAGIRSLRTVLANVARLVKR